MLDQVTVRRGGQLIIDNVSFSLACGEIVALVGPNGGGKSTLLRTILGEWKYQGQISFFDQQGRAMRPCIGYMPQHLSFDRNAPLTVADFLSLRQSHRPVFLGAGRASRQSSSKLLEQVGATHLLDRRLGELSGGELQRVTLAFALDPTPDILLLDEPASALDEKGQVLFYELVSDLRERFDLLTLIVSHDLDVIVDYATTAIILNHQIQAAGPPRTVLARRLGGEL